MEYNKPKKDRSTALLLAIFCGPWTFLYTYKYDKVKFWLAIGLFIPTLSISSIILHIIGLVQAITRDDYFYENYYDRIDTRSNFSNKHISLVFKKDNDDLFNLKIQEVFKRIYKYKKVGKFKFWRIFSIIIHIILTIFGFIFLFVGLFDAGGRNFVPTFLGVTPILTISLIITIIISVSCTKKIKLYRNNLKSALSDLGKLNPEAYDSLGGIDKVLDYF